MEGLQRMRKEHWSKMQEQALISIIVAAYNIESYLSRCLDSILAQTYQNLEIIVVDDGSVDATGKICDEYAQKDSRIQVIHQMNMGLSGARNSGLKIATGEYVGYVDGDDYIEPEMYEAMLHACMQNDAQLAICAYQQIGNERPQSSFSRKEYVLTREEALEIYICDNKSYHIYNAVWSKLFRQDILKGMEFPMGHKSEDIPYTTKALINTTRCVFLDTPYYNYVVDREDSIMNQHIHERRFRDEIPFWKEQQGYLYGVGMKELADKASYQFYRRMLFYFIDFKKRKMGDSARQLIQMLRDDQKKIRSIYHNPYVATGDKVRMRVALRTPNLYYVLVKLYDKFVIPLRQ